MLILWVTGIINYAKLPDAPATWVLQATRFWISFVA
jgi:hypothetical protein